MTSAWHEHLRRFRELHPGEPNAFRRASLSYRSAGGAHGGGARGESVPQIIAQIRSMPTIAQVAFTRYLESHGLTTSGMGVVELASALKRSGGLGRMSTAQITQSLVQFARAFPATYRYEDPLFKLVGDRGSASSAPARPTASSSSSSSSSSAPSSGPARRSSSSSSSSSSGRTAEQRRKWLDAQSSERKRRREPEMGRSQEEASALLGQIVNSAVVKLSVDHSLTSAQRARSGKQLEYVRGMQTMLKTNKLQNQDAQDLQAALRGALNVHMRSPLRALEVTAQALGDVVFESDGESYPLSD